MLEIVITVNNHLTAICQTYPPYNNTETCVEPDGPNLEFIKEHHTYYLLKMFSKKFLGPGNFPLQIVTEFAADLTFLFFDITNAAL